MCFKNKTKTNGSNPKMSNGSFGASAAPTTSFSQDLDNLFGTEGEVREGALQGGNADLDWNTLDESIWRTLKRDVDRVVTNTKGVLWPFEGGRDPTKPLREWDLWGPLVFVLLLGICLSSDADDASTVFSIVFATVAFGAVALTLNVVLLGGNIIFLQAISLLGYCLAPLNVAVILMLISGNKVYRTILAVGAVGWSSWASIPFISAAVPPSRKALAVYPVMLLYISLGMLAIVSA